MNKKRKITLHQVREFLFKRGLIAIEKNKKSFLKDSFKGFYYTLLSSFVIIGLFSLMPFVFEFKKNNFDISKEITNKSKTNFEKVLDGGVLKNPKLDEGLDLKNLFDDVFRFDDLPSDTVRLNASTIEQLFKDTNYNLKDVRKNKLVKPIALDSFPREIKMIETVKKIYSFKLFYL